MVQNTTLGVAFMDKFQTKAGTATVGLQFINLDPPDHNRLRRVVMHQFTPERVEGMRDLVIQIVDELIDA